MLLELIIALHLKILFTENSKVDCLMGIEANGCYLKDNRIYLSYKSDNINRTLYHEIGHALFLRNNFSRTIIKDYADILKHKKNEDTTENDILNERVADYFADYMLNNKEFSVKYPCLYIYFRDTLNKFI